VDPAWFEKVLYPFQDEALAVAARVETGFYLTGGTALGRIHLRHRYSEDLDLFVNDDDRFQAWADRLLEAWRAQAGWQLTVQRRDPRFVRASLSRDDVPLKIEFVNDVRGRVGTPVRHAGFGLVDTMENILANKVAALLDREEPKDLADVWGLCGKGGLGLRDALVGASSKAVGVFAADVARALLGATEDDWRLVRWIPPPAPVEDFLRDLRALGEDLLLIR
jgi:hypothetical protein